MIVFQKYLFIFFVYAISGWIMESTRGWIKTGKFVNRGFLIGPCLPVYGFGLVLITACLEKYIDNIIILFCLSILLCRNFRVFYKLGNGKIF